MDDDNGWNSLEHYWFQMKLKWYYWRLSDHIDDLAEDIEEELERNGREEEKVDKDSTDS